MSLRVTAVQRFCMHDGPGLRTTVFFKGCPLRCKWCHNPETQNFRPELLFYENRCIACSACTLCPQGAQIIAPVRTVNRSLCRACGLCAEACPAGALEIAGRDTSPEALWEEIRADLPFYGTEGGVTLSGGEPFAQPADELFALCALAKESQVHVAAQTCGAFDPGVLPRIRESVDLLLFDVKDTDPARLKAYTGGDLEAILANLREADALGIPVILVCIQVPGVNDDPAHGAAIEALRASLRHCRGVRFIPCHSYSNGKYAHLGRVAPF